MGLGSVAHSTHTQIRSTFRRVSLWHIAVPAAEWVKATSPMLTQRVRFLLRAITASQQHFKICSGISIATIVKIYEGRRIRARFGVSWVAAGFAQSFTLRPRSLTTNIQNSTRFQSATLQFSTSSHGRSGQYGIFVRSKSACMEQL